jgi:hypothetical protein
VLPDASSKPAWKTFVRPAAGQLVGYRADLWNLRTSHTSLREKLTKQLLLKGRRKTGKLPNLPARVRQNFC